MSDEPLVRVFVPALAPLLARAEQLKGGPLSEQEVLRLRDEATCVAVPADQAAAIERGRGYRDLDPDDCWEQWQDLREELKAIDRNAGE